MAKALSGVSAFWWLINTSFGMFSLAPGSEALSEQVAHYVSCGSAPAFDRGLKLSVAGAVAGAMPCLVTMLHTHVDVQFRLSKSCMVESAVIPYPSFLPCALLACLYTRAHKQLLTVRLQRRQRQEVAWA